MAQILSGFSRDANGVPIWTKGLLVSKTITYVAGTTGAIASVTLFTVTGTVIVNIFAVCSLADLTGVNTTIEVGVTGNTAALLPLTTAVNLDVGDIWTNVTTFTKAEAVLSDKIVNSDILQEIKTTAMSGGTLTYYCFWNPVSSDGNVVAA